MKKILIILICATLAFSACNKNKKFNKTLDGTWMQTTEDGVAIPSEDATKLTFSKDKKDDGKITIQGYEDGVLQMVANGTYKISEKGEKLVIDASGSGAFGGGSYSITYHLDGAISDQTKTKFKYTATMTGSMTTTFGGQVMNSNLSDNAVMEFTKQ